jgi:hypothetical protein
MNRSGGGLVGDKPAWLGDLERALGAAGVARDERLQLTEASPAAIVLERLGGATPPAPGPPVLSANLSVLPLAGLLQAILEARRSGLLVYRHRRHEKTIYFQLGEVIFASSNQVVDRLGECLLRSGAINAEELREAERAFVAGDRFGRTLVERGFLTPRELWNGVRNQVEEIVRSLFVVPEGRVWFWEGEFQPDNVVRLSLETSRLISEGQQRSAELRKFLSVLEDPRVQLARTADTRATLAGSERAIFDSISAGRSFPELCSQLGLDRESAARSVQLLRLVGAVKLMRLPDASAREPVDAGLTAQAGALVKLIAALRGAIASAEGSSAVDERLARVLHEAAARFPALLAGVDLGPGGALDAELLAERATRIPGLGRESLATALGELAAYLEFELVNHPKLSDPAAFLASLEPLRRAAAG